MTPDQSEQLRAWMQDRFDRLEDQVDKQTGEMRSDLIETRHGQREVSEQITIQVVSIQQTVNQHINDINGLKITVSNSEGWRNRMIGAIAVLLFLFPATVAVILKYS